MSKITLSLDSSDFLFGVLLHESDLISQLQRLAGEVHCDDRVDGRWQVSTSAPSRGLMAFCVYFHSCMSAVVQYFE